MHEFCVNHNEPTTRNLLRFYVQFIKFTDGQKLKKVEVLAAVLTYLVLHGSMVLVPVIMVLNSSFVKSLALSLAVIAVPCHGMELPWPLPWTGKCQNWVAMFTDDKLCLWHTGTGLAIARQYWNVEYQ